MEYFYDKKNYSSSCEKKAEQVAARGEEEDKRAVCYKEKAKHSSCCSKKEKNCFSHSR
jgi:hypothetical protein